MRTAPAAAGIAFVAAWVTGLAVWPTNLNVAASGGKVVSAYTGHQGVAVAQYLLVEGLPAIALTIVVIVLVPLLLLAVGAIFAGMVFDEKFVGADRAEFWRAASSSSAGTESMKFLASQMAIGSAVHWTFGSISTPILLQLLAGGVPGVVLGCLLARKVPAQRLKAVVAAVALVAGLQLVWSGARAYAAQHSTAAAKLDTRVPGVSRP